MRSSRIIRSFVLAASTLALVGVLFALYQSGEGGSRPVPPAGPIHSPPATREPMVQASDTQGQGAQVLIGKERFPVTGGEKVLIDFFEPRRAQLEVSEWKPIGQEGTEFEVTSPVIRMRTSNGQLVRFSADTGSVLLKSPDPRSPDPKSCNLIGNVQISIDRLSQEQRADLGAGQRDEATDEHRVDLFMDDVFFDFEFARIETGGPFRVRSAEVSIDGVGLSVRYNEVQSRIEELIVDHGGKIDARGMGDRLGMDFSSAADTTVGQREPTPAEAPAALADDRQNVPAAVDHASATASDQEDIPLLLPDEPQRPRMRPTDVYTAVFAGDVRVSQFAGNERTGNLLAEQLDVLFDFGQRERETVRKTPQVGRQGLDADESSSAGPAGVQAAEGEAERIELTWSGALRVTSAPQPEEAELHAHSKEEPRVHITATGDPVLANDAKRRIECRRLVYQRESGMMQLLGSADEPAFVGADRLGLLWGRELVFGRDARTARVSGPGGRLIVSRADAFAGDTSRASETSEGADRELDIRFDEQADATFGEMAIEQVDKATGQARQTTRQYLQTAVFRGNVEMARGSELIKCGRVDIDFGLNAAGRPFVERGEFHDDIVAMQGGRHIEARDRMIVEVESIETVDDGGRSQRAALERLEAVGEVAIRDPEQRLEINCDSLNCRFDERGRIESGRVAEADGRNAYVALSDFSIGSPQPIVFSVPDQHAEVDGAGQMTFLSEQDFDGRALDEPEPVRVEWSRRMSFHGLHNEAVFDGDVRVETENSSYECADLRVDFVDRAPSSEEPGGVESDGQPQWWIFRPLVTRLTGREDDGGLSFVAESPSIQKDPVFIYATGGVVAQTRNLNDASGAVKSRVHLSGPTMAVDLVDRYIHVNGQGNLLIEDYRVTEPETQAAAPRSRGVPITPFGEVLQGGPSQTFIAWENGMNYRYGINVAEFDKDVVLVHRTGAKMKLAREITGREPDGASADGGREASLNCQSLVASFLRSDEGDGAGAGRMSGNEVDALNASGQVYFADGGVSAIARQITYMRDDGVLQILGTEENPAQLFDQRSGFREFTGPRIYWDRTSNRIRAPGSRGRMN